MADKNIFDIITAEAMAAYYEKLASNKIPYLGTGLFPSKKKQGLRLEWIKGHDSLPVMLQPSAFDAKPLLRDRGGITMETTRMPFFRESARIGEEERQQLLQFRSENHGAYADAILEKIFDDVTGLIESAGVNAEVMRMSLLGNDGVINIATPSAQGQVVGYSYNFDPNGAWAAKNKTTLTGTAVWSDTTNSDPIKDIMDIKREAMKQGKNITRAVIGYDTYQDLCANDKVRRQMFPGIYTTPNAVEGYFSDEEIIKFIEGKTGIRFAVYTKTYKDFNGKTQYFFPQSGVACFFNSMALGTTWYGTTPEEADLMSGSGDGATCRVVDNGVAVCTKKESLPVNVMTWVSEIVLPSYEGMDDVFVINY